MDNKIGRQLNSEELEQVTGGADADDFIVSMLQMELAQNPQDITEGGAVIDKTGFCRGMV